MSIEENVLEEGALEEKMRSLIQSSNQITGKSDATLTDAIQSLVDGYGGGSAYSTNIHDPSKDILNTYISDSNGNQIAYNGWSSTDFIAVSPDVKYLLIQGNLDKYNAFYTENRTYITSFRGASVIPDNAKYFRISGTTPNMNSLKIFFAIE